MSAHDEIMKKINAKVNKNKQIRNANKNDTVEDLVFKFFEEMDGFSAMRAKHGDESVDYFAGITEMGAIFQLEEKIRKKYDRDCRVTLTRSDDDRPIGVTVHWSKSYQVANKVSETEYIGIEQLLFRDPS